tara:strand:+ start:690 stop:1046 length:357 start_codon:yes stop_codon:yes gene_type:complete
MTDVAPERIWAEPSNEPEEWTATADCRTLHDVEYVRADLASAAVRRAEALAEAESDALTTAQARIAELEAALGFYANRENWRSRWEQATDGKSCLQFGKGPARRDAGKIARRALEDKP